jgi:preprotein translocase subunit SecD
MKKKNLRLWLIIILTAISVWIDLPGKFKLKGQVGKYLIDKEFTRPEINLKIGQISFKKELKIVKGLDLQGGAHLVFEADMGKIPQENREEALEAARQNIERRVNFFGVSEPIIQSARVGESSRVIVELAGVKDIDQAVDLIGKTAQLDFREQNPSTASGQPPFLKTDLTGRDLKRSTVQFDQNTGQPVVGLEFSPEGTKKFGEITTKNVGRLLAIYLDETIVSAPRVEEAITTGKAIIRGEFPLDVAKRLSIQLNAGALPVPIKIIEQRNVGATLGEESVQRSLRAGFFGLLLVISFMWLYYGKLGLIADLTLIIYGLLTLALYKLIPVILTLPGIAGFLLSVGMAVDSNILIFERFKEERRAGKPLAVALELGFGRAWDSIRDANITTLITALILFNPFNWPFLNVSGMVRGFALTLVLGTILSLFTGIVVSRTLIKVFYKG